MPFGQYMFVEIKDLPDSYLAWLMDTEHETMLKQFGILEAVQNEWRRRTPTHKSYVVCTHCGKTTDTPIRKYDSLFCTNCAPRM